ncbi:hypothetical protein BaRGS_00019062 [Batillaria attramentaria]|uniref:Uncharacterized protein n=1 Tax=Batillaria attramentaria TaxID=370345 RepID=A0ABD0KRE1_9CAEN
MEVPHSLPLFLSKSTDVSCESDFEVWGQPQLTPSNLNQCLSTQQASDHREDFWIYASTVGAVSGDSRQPSGYLRLSREAGSTTIAHGYLTKT